MIKTLGKVLTMVITGMIFTFSLTGCIPAGSHSQSEVSQSEVSQLEVSLEISSAAETFSAEELEIAKNQLPSVIAILINATLSEEPIKDGSRMSMESILRRNQSTICNRRRYGIYARMQVSFYGTCSTNCA